MNRWLITGAGGMLGQDLVALLHQAGESVVAASRRDLDLTDGDAVRSALRRRRPDLVVNCAAWTAVDDAEDHEAQAAGVNGHAVRGLAMACAEAGARLVQLSTDYVFDGTATRPYQEDAPTAPLNAYGRTKLAGESAVLELLPDAGYVVRTAWLYGAHGPNFVRTMIRLEGSKDTIDVVDDQHGQPTWTADVADRILALARSGTAPPGVYHATSSGAATWYELAREVFRLLGADPGRVRPISSDRLQRPTPRPAYTVLGHGGWRRAHLDPIRGWAAALGSAFPTLRAGRPA